MAVVNSNYEFIMVDAGINGRISDGGVLNYTEFGRALSNKLLQNPEPRELPNNFWRIAQFPDVIGVIDCTHIAIVPPKIDDPVNPSIAYINRKGFHSVNVQAIFDSQLMLTNVNAKYSEAVHDAAIWDSSNIQTHLGQKYEDGRRNCYLLGDSGYHLQPWLMTPILETRPNTPEEQEYEDNDNSDDILKRLVTAAILILLQFQAIIF
ncbi:unnamed protein product [Acanthoscelides obtectus]|uniref:DDE Tnp4 domain-containing protein n=1 Tax=Acanthoscelides obtectus TaxID=200917 RepID=A0A9P0LBB9_ACAOB|nr:unnamed protein product [Acanthoscelides obtectus]CAK1671744.1 Putative nuclease HARBI1 [Acanthoscelides obtectus]